VQMIVSLMVVHSKDSRKVKHPETKTGVSIWTRQKAVRTHLDRDKKDGDKQVSNKIREKRHSNHLDNTQKGRWVRLRVRRARIRRASRFWILIALTIAKEWIQRGSSRIVPAAVKKTLWAQIDSQAINSKQFWMMATQTQNARATSRTQIKIVMRMRTPGWTRTCEPWSTNNSSAIIWESL